jgi:ribonuclease-3
MDLYYQVFTHKSVAAYFGRDSYERLEFLGDAAISHIVTSFLFAKYPSEDEGFLTKLRTRLVSGPSLAMFARCLGLDRFVVMNAKSMEKNFHQNKRILEDVFEALCGAIYLDSGLVQLKTFLMMVLHRYADWDALHVDTNHKDILMRFTQAQTNVPLPMYDINSTPSHPGGLFHVTVLVCGCSGQGSGTSKRAAEQMAALGCLRQLKYVIRDPGNAKFFVHVTDSSSSCPHLKKTQVPSYQQQPPSYQQQQPSYHQHPSLLVVAPPPPPPYPRRTRE